MRSGAPASAQAQHEQPNAGCGGRVLAGRASHRRTVASPLALGCDIHGGGSSTPPPKKAPPVGRAFAGRTRSDVDQSIHPDGGCYCLRAFTSIAGCSSFQQFCETAKVPTPPGASQ